MSTTGGSGVSGAARGQRRRGISASTLACLTSTLCLVVAACGGAESTAPSDPIITTAGEDSDPAGNTDPTATTSAGDTDGAVDESDLAAAATTFLATDADDQSTQLAALSADVERQLYAASGLEEAIGGAANAEESIAETAAWFASLAEESVAAIDVEQDGPTGLRRPAPGTPDLGEGLFGGMLANVVLAKASAAMADTGEEGSKPVNGIKINVKGALAETSSDVSFTDKHGVSTTLQTTSRVLRCPNEEGLFEATATMETGSTVDSGRTGKRARFVSTVRGIVGDDAQILEYDYEVRGEVADFQQSRGKYADVSVGYPANGPVVVNINRTGGAVDQALVDLTGTLAAYLGLVMSILLKDAAQAGWESGRCVTLAPTTSAGPSGLATNAVVTITAAPRSTTDGKPTGGTVTATLSAGETAVDPTATKVPADATFTYTAPGEIDRSGTVTLEARSRRGVGKASIDFDTRRRGYTASGGGQDVVIVGAVGDLMQPFSLAAEFVGGSGLFSYTGDERGGTVTVAGQGGGAVVTGSGTYTIVDNPDGTKTLTQTVEACVDVNSFCNTTTQVIVLTPD